MTVGERIKQERINKGMTQQELAERMGRKNKSSVCRVENNSEDLTVSRVTAYAKALGCTVETLIKGTTPANFILSEDEKELIHKLRCIDRTTYDNVITLVDVAYEKSINRKKDVSGS